MSDREKTISYLFYVPTGISRLEKMGQLVIFPKNHTFVEAGNQTKYCYVVKKGRVAAYELCPNGEERIYGIYEKNSLFLESELLFHKMVTISYKTIVSTELIRIEKSVLMNAIKADPQLALDIMEATSDKLSASLEQIRHDKNYSISWKICDLLLTFAKYYGVPYGDKVLIREKISQQMMSNLLGVNRITTVRAIKKLREEGVLEVVDGLYCIPDVEILREYQENVA